MVIEIKFSKDAYKVSMLFSNHRFHFRKEYLAVALVFNFVCIFVSFP